MGGRVRCRLRHASRAQLIEELLPASAPNPVLAAWDKLHRAQLAGDNQPVRTAGRVAVLVLDLLEGEQSLRRGRSTPARFTSWARECVSWILLRHGRAL